ncbi:DUF6153 family protein [Herbiconiux sp. YIM B11900]|uniref:DUF6153 family protein n=1 Tax=Herbiconiux sp. YIM B11900 TaxID=3404131 RepID=UPI003F85BA22
MSIRATLLRPASLQKTLLLISVIIAVVAGLLAMHTMAATTGHSEPATAAMTMTSDEHTNATSSAPVGDNCVQECTPEHDMTAMICVLALLVGGLFLVIALLRAGGLASVAVRLQPLIRALRATGSFPFRDPPDLSKLSISRT